VYGDLGTLSAMAGAFAEALFTAGTILWIIFPALCIHQGQAGRQLSIYARANPLGLLPEQIDPGSGAFLGNYPQAFSHIGLISSAVNLARFMKKERS
jgi:hypothetical protein